MVKTRQRGEHPVELLPWLANGTLEGEERERVRRHVAACARCRAELEFLETLRRGVKACWTGEEPGELGWARVRASIRRETEFRPRRSRTFLDLRWMAAAAAVLVVVQTGVIAYLTLGPGAGPALYQPLGAEQQRPVLQVRFRPDASEARIRALLRETGVEIVAGPSALGIYSLAPVEGGQEALAQAHRRLEAAHDVVVDVRRP